MSSDWFGQYWALLAAGTIALALLLFFARLLWAGTSRGRLRRAHAGLKRAQAEAAQAGRSEARFARRLERLGARAESVKPRLIEEARADHADAQAMKKIRDDQVLVARNLVRKAIFEEFPPTRHATLTRRYLGENAGESRTSGV